MPVTYAVSWQEPDGTVGSGRLELGTDALLLEGRNGSSGVRRAFPYRQMTGFRIARGSGDRLQGRPTLVVALDGGSELRIAGVAQPGIVSELAGRLGALRQDPGVLERVAVVVPLKPGARAKARALLATGPPFDPTALGLARHEVFLTDDEAVFVFEGVPAALLSRIADQSDIWAAADAWQPLIAGPLRYADPAYTWPS